MPVQIPFSMRQLTPGDVALLEALLTCFGAAFDEVETYLAARPSYSYLERLLYSDTFIALVAKEHQAVDGLAACELKKFWQERSEVYLNDLATHRREGVATALLHALRSVAAARGARGVFVQVRTRRQALQEVWRARRGAALRHRVFERRRLTKSDGYSEVPRTRRLPCWARDARLTPPSENKLPLCPSPSLSPCQNKPVPHYLATLTLLSQLAVRPPSGKNPPKVILHHNDTPVVANVPRWLIDRLSQAPPEVFKVNLHPKTDRAGVLAPTSRLATWSEPKGDEEAGVFHVVGQVVFVDRDEAKLVVRVHPNPKGNLSKAFMLTFQTNLELLDKVPKRGEGVEVKGLLKTPSRRLVITDLQAVPLPPIREEAKNKAAVAKKVKG